MKKLVSAKLAGNILLLALGALAVFHVLVLLGIVPPDIVWGGQAAATPENLFALEIVALIVTILFVVLIAMKLNYFGGGKFRRAVNIGIWILFAYLVLNTLGNLASGVTLEKLLFTPITIILALLALRLALEPAAN